MKRILLLAFSLAACGPAFLVSDGADRESEARESTMATPDDDDAGPSDDIGVTSPCAHVDAPCDDMTCPAPSGDTSWAVVHIVCPLDDAPHDGTGGCVVISSDAASRTLCCCAPVVAK